MRTEKHAAAYFSIFSNETIARIFKPDMDAISKDEERLAFQTGRKYAKERPASG